MADAVLCSRALGQTLIACVSTFGLFIAANWETLHPLVPGASWNKNLVGSILNSLALPSLGFVKTMRNVVRVWIMRTTLSQSWPSEDEIAEPAPIGSGSVAIMTVCPIIIEIPAGQLSSEEEVAIKKLNVLNSLEGLDALMLPPRGGGKAGVELGSSDDNINNQSEEIVAGNSDVNTQSSHDSECVEWADARSDLSASSINNQSSNDSGDVDAADASPRDDDHIDTNTGRRRYLNLSSIEARRNVQLMRYRVALIGLGLVPAYNQLKYLRSGGLFVTVVTMLQAVGFMLTILQRVVGHAAVSPLEAILTYLSFNVTLQMMVEMFVCGHYKGPLLLSLTPAQFSAFIHTAHQLPLPLRIGCFRKPRLGQLLLLFLGLSLALLVFVPVPFLLYARSHYCLYLCTSSADVFFFVTLATALVAVIQTVILSRCGHLADLLRRLIPYYLSFTSFSYTASIALALVATIKDWEMFDKPTPTTLYAWILPHIST